MSYGQNLLKQYLNLLITNKILNINYRPDWLFGMELDIFYPELGLAFEFQGHQHFAPSESFGNCVDQKNRDKLKKKLCEDNQIILVVIDASELEYTRLIFRLKQAGGKLKRLNKKLKFIRKKLDKESLRRLNHECIKYRKILRENFDDVTSYRKKTKLRKNAMKKAFDNFKD